jgi:hypothetical protein
LGAIILSALRPNATHSPYLFPPKSGLTLPHRTGAADASIRQFSIPDVIVTPPTSSKAPADNALAVTSVRRTFSVPTTARGELLHATANHAPAIIKIAFTYIFNPP